LSERSKQHVVSSQLLPARGSSNYATYSASLPGFDEWLLSIHLESSFAEQECEKYHRHENLDRLLSEDLGGTLK
jgi:hypothetical protein